MTSTGAGSGPYVSCMIERDIPPDSRNQFFAMLSKGHRGAFIDVRVGREDEVVAQPFSGVSADGKDLVIHIGGGLGQPHHAHRVSSVDAVRLSETDDGAAAILTILSGDGTRTEVTFRSPIREALLDPAVE